MDGNKAPRGKQAGPNMCLHHELIFICRESDLTASLSSSTKTADSCCLSHILASFLPFPRNLPMGFVLPVIQGVEVKPGHCTALLRMCWCTETFATSCFIEWHNLCRSIAATRVPWGLILSYSSISRLRWQKQKTASPTMPPSAALVRTSCCQLSRMRQQQRKPWPTSHWPQEQTFLCLLTQYHSCLTSST